MVTSNDGCCCNSVRLLATRCHGVSLEMPSHSLAAHVSAYVQCHNVPLDTWVCSEGGQPLAQACRLWLIPCTASFGMLSRAYNSLIVICWITPFIHSLIESNVCSRQHPLCPAPIFKIVNSRINTGRCVAGGQWVCPVPERAADIPEQPAAALL